MEKIDTNKIQGRYNTIDLDGNCSGGDDTIKSIKLVADKVNEIVEWINEQENCNNKRFYGVGEHEIYSNLLTQASNKRLGEMLEQLKDMGTNVCNNCGRYTHPNDQNKLKHVCIKNK